MTSNASLKPFGGAAEFPMTVTSGLRLARFSYSHSERLVSLSEKEVQKNLKDTEKVLVAVCNCLWKTWKRQLQRQHA